MTQITKRAIDILHIYPPLDLIYALRSLVFNRLIVNQKAKASDIYN